MQDSWILEMVAGEHRKLARIVRFCIELGYADGAYIYARILARDIIDYNEVNNGKV